MVTIVGDGGEGSGVIIVNGEGGGGVKMMQLLVKISLNTP